jgi:hypothetical protein
MGPSFGIGYFKALMNTGHVRFLQDERRMNAPLEVIKVAYSNVSVQLELRHSRDYWNYIGGTYFRYHMATESLARFSEKPETRAVMRMIYGDEYVAAAEHFGITPYRANVVLRKLKTQLGLTFQGIDGIKQNLISKDMAGSGTDFDQAKLVSELFKEEGSSSSSSSSSSSQSISSESPIDSIQFSSSDSIQFSSSSSSGSGSSTSGTTTPLKTAYPDLYFGLDVGAGNEGNESGRTNTDSPSGSASGAKTGATASSAGGASISGASISENQRNPNVKASSVKVSPSAKDSQKGDKYAPGRLRSNSIYARAGIDGRIVGSDGSLGVGTLGSFGSRPGRHPGSGGPTTARPHEQGTRNLSE